MSNGQPVLRTCATLACATLLAGAVAAAGNAAAPQKHYGRTAAESSPPAWPRNPQAPAGAPNVLVILTDDVGFGASTTFGGPIPTPTLDSLAHDGLRYNAFNTTAICSPTRASLLTGRNPHNVGVGLVTNLPTGYDGYTSVIPKSAGTVARVLEDNGYGTAMFGKGHITPEWEMSRAGPFDRWPTGLGFEYFYGFIGADTSLFAPALVENTSFIEPPHDDPSYHLERDLADHAIRWLADQHALAPDKPFFIYYATPTAHSPNHAPREWLAKFRGAFDQGWDAVREQTFEKQRAQGVIPRDAELAPRPPQLPQWSSLSADQKRLYARFMEAYAASLAYSDAQVGRVIEHLRASGQLDNTMVIFIEGDNGSSAEGRRDGQLFEQAGINNLVDTPEEMLRHIDDIGGPDSYPLYPGGWGFAMNTPFPWYKRVASHFGGTRNGMVISWPARIRDHGGLRTQFHHVSDIMPTILEAAGVSAPASIDGVAQKPLDGVSMLYTFADSAAPSRRRTQVFEIMENLGIYAGGWVAATRPTTTAWDAQKSLKVPLDQRAWELYDTRSDFSEAHDLAAKMPQKLAELQQLFWSEAARNGILPIHSPDEGAAGAPSLIAGRTTLSYRAGTVRVPESTAPHTLRHSYRFEAQISVPHQGATGVVVTHGGRFGGYALYLHEGRPVFFYNALGPRQYRIESTQALPGGEHRLAAEFRADSDKPGAGGTLTLALDGREVARGRIEQTLSAWLSHTEGFDVGEDTITPINGDYTIASSRFTGTLEQLVFTQQ